MIHLTNQKRLLQQLFIRQVLCEESTREALEQPSSKEGVGEALGPFGVECASKMDGSMGDTRQCWCVGDPISQWAAGLVILVAGGGATGLMCLT